MRGCCKKEEKRKSVRLEFRRKELLYDVENYAYVEGDIMVTDNEHARHQLIDIGQSGNIDRVSRVLALAHGECVEMLYPYSKREIPDERQVVDDELRVPEVYGICLTLPEEFSMTTISLLKDLLHEYMVSRVLADWMSITNPGGQSNWEVKVEALRSKIQTALMSRHRRMRRKCKPF